MQSSLRGFVDNLPQIADWRATLSRVVAFRDALATVDTIGADTGRIEVIDSASDKLVLDDVQLALPEVCLTLDQRRVEISPGDRIQILGEAASGKSTLFRALAGMWPWGGGRPPAAPRVMTFMPERPYLARHAARGCAIPMSTGTSTRLRGRCARAGGPRAPSALARQDGALGPTTASGRAAAPGVRAPVAAGAALGRA